MATICWARRYVLPADRVDGVGLHLLGDAAHFGDHALQVLQFGVESRDGVIGHDALSVIGMRSWLQPKRPVM